MIPSQSLLHKYLQNKNIDGIFVTKPENIFWLTGFWGSFALFIQTKNGDRFLITDGRYIERAQALSQKNNFTAHLLTRENENEISKILKKELLNFFLEDTTSLRKEKWGQQLFPNLTFSATENVLETLRKQKTETEIEKIKTAQQQVDKVLVPFLKANARKNISEKELAFRFEVALKGNGKFELSFPIIIAFGENSAIPHHESSDRTLQLGDNILIDCGVKFQRFCSDMTRNFCFGEADQAYLQYYQQLKTIQEKTLLKYIPDQKITDIENFCRKQLQDEAPFFTHSLGHGVGLEIHEEPRISLSSKDRLQKNEIVTCEPGLYFPQKFGIRIEDLLVIRDKEPEILSQTSKDLLRINEETDVKKLC